MDEGMAGEARVFQLGMFGSTERMNWAGTWAARRVVETATMEVRCILDGGLWRVVGLYCGFDIEAIVGAGVVGVVGGER